VEEEEEEERQVLESDGEEQDIDHVAEDIYGGSEINSFAPKGRAPKMMVSNASVFSTELGMDGGGSGATAPSGAPILLSDGTLVLPDGRRLLPDGTLLPAQGDVPTPLGASAISFSPTVVAAYEEEQLYFLEEVSLSVAMAEEHRYAEWLAYFDAVVLHARRVKKSGENKDSCTDECTSAEQKMLDMEERDVGTREIETIPSSIVPLPPETLSLVLAALYPKWRCKISGERETSQEALRAVVSAAKVGAEGILTERGARPPFTLPQLRNAFLIFESDVQGRRVSGMGKCERVRGQERQGWSRSWFGGEDRDVLQ